MKRIGLRGVAFAWFVAASCLAFGENYLIVHSTDAVSAADVRAQILGTGLVQGNVDLRSATSSTPTVSQLKAYDAVFVFGANGFQNAGQLGENLANYADAGGGVVVAPLTTAASGPFVPSGRFRDNGYSPFTGGTTKQFIARRLGQVYDVQHPLMLGVASFHGGSASLHNQVGLSAGAVRVADYDNGVPLVACKQVGTSFVVGLNFFPPSGAVQSGYWVTTTGGARLMANALKFAPGVRNVAPVAVGETFTVEAGTALTVAAPGLLANDSDADGNALALADSDAATSGVQVATGPTNGTLVAGVDGSFTYTPNYGFKGTDSFSYRATDGTALSNLASTTVSVVDTTAPVITGTPNNQTASATGPGGAVFNYTLPTAVDSVDGVVTVQASTASGSEFALGSTLVTFTATDAAGNASQTSFSVSVVDVTPPVFSKTPADTIVVATSSSGNIVQYCTPVSTDAVDGAVAVTSTVASGALFGLGQTTVTFTATDAAGNQAQTSFKVWVRYSASELDTSGNSDKGLKAGSVVKLRFALTGESASVTDANANVTSNPGGANCQFVYDATTGVYSASWKTKGLAPGAYELKLDLGDGVVRTQIVRLR